MRVRGWVVMTVAAVGLAGCATKVPPPRVVATLPPPAPPPPVMPAGGYAGLDIPAKRDDGTYVTPNFQMTPAAAVWHLRGALNVAALACDQAGGGVLEGYNAWIVGHRAALDGYVKQYLHEWEVTGWSDWRDAYEAQQTRLYNFYSQSPIRVAFCAAAREEIGTVATIPDAELPTYARGALVRLDKPFVDFFTAFDAWRDYYAPKVPPPKFVATIPDPEPEEAAAATVPAPTPAAPPTPAPAGR